MGYKTTKTKRTHENKTGGDGVTRTATMATDDVDVYL